MTEQPPYGGPPPEPAVAHAQAAGLGVRFGARFLDGLVFFALSLVVGILIAAVGLVSGGAGSFTAFGGDGYAESAILAVVQTAIWMGYFVFLETSRGQTLGKMVLKLRVVSESGGNPTIEQSVKRNIFLAFGLAAIIPFLGFIGGLAQLAAVIAIAVTISSDPGNRGWHDKFGSTQVLRVG